METIKKGSRGEAVKILQQLIGITADGIFGAGTEAKLKEYQKKNGLTADGVCGSKTWDVLLGAPNITRMAINTHITRSPGREIKYLVIHYTAGRNSIKGAAQSNRNVFLTSAASADFCVDDETIIQVNPDLKNYYCWAVGDGAGKYGITNKNCISIEMCSTLKSGTIPNMANHAGWSISDAVLKNTAKLARWLMKEYNIPKERVVRHYDASRKYCPGVIGWNDGLICDAKTGNSTGRKNNSLKWQEWKDAL